MHVSVCIKMELKEKSILKLFLSQNFCTYYTLQCLSAGVALVEPRVHTKTRDNIRLKGAGTIRSITERINDLEYFRHWKFYPSQIGFKIAECNSQKIVKNV